MTTTPAPSQAPAEFSVLFSRSWELFKRNWIVAIPTVITGFLVVLIVVALTVASVVGVMGYSGHLRASTISSGTVIAACAAFFFLIVLLGLWCQIATYAMADAAWTRGSTTLADGFAAFPSRWAAVLVAWIGLFGITMLAIILALPTLGFSFIGLPFATMYVLPAAIVGRRGGFEAIAETFTLLRRFFVPALLTWLGLYAIQYGLSFLMYFVIVPLQFSLVSTGSSPTLQMPPIPLLAFCGFGITLFFLVMLAYAGFSAIVLVGSYRDLAGKMPTAQIS